MASLCYGLNVHQILMKQIRQDSMKLSDAISHHLTIKMTQTNEDLVRNVLFDLGLSEDDVQFHTLVSKYSPSYMCDKTHSLVAKGKRGRPSKKEDPLLPFASDSVPASASPHTPDQGTKSVSPSAPKKKRGRPRKVVEPETLTDTPQLNLGKELAGVSVSGADSPNAEAVEADVEEDEVEEEEAKVEEDEEDEKDEVEEDDEEEDDEDEDEVEEEEDDEDEDEEDEDEVEVEEICVRGTKYLRDGSGVIYSYESQDEVGHWDVDAQTIVFSP